MPARRKNKKKLNYRSGIFKFFLFVFLILGVYIFYQLFTREGEWDGKSKLNLVINGDDSIIVSTLDPQKQELVKVVIPAETEVEVARDLGKWKIGSVWKLGENEGVGGKLLAETVTRHFHLPVYLYADKDAEGLLNTGYVTGFRAVLYPMESNLSKKDLFKIARFIGSVNNADRKTIELKDTSSIREVELKGGGVGYQKVRDLAPHIIAPFSNEDIANRITTVKIINNSSNRIVATELGGVIEATGAKVAQIVNSDEKQGDCYVKSENSSLVNYYSNLFSCGEDLSGGESFDVVITLNSDFIQRY